MDLTIILILIVIGGTIAVVIMILKNLGGMFLLIRHALTPIPQADRDLLKLHSAYYGSLPDSARKEFEKRVKEVLFEKEWMGQGIEVSREMRVRIAAALVQLTIGLDRLLLLHFKRIVVFPNEYLDRNSGKWHQGDVKPGAGTIALSWKHFQLGYHDPQDARNVGLHELAHALWFENQIPNQEHNFIHPDLLEEWKRKAAVEIDRIRHGESSVLRAYASTNQAEFFAVAVEYFFEQPVPFKEGLPELYATLSAILKQDPVSITKVPLATL